MGLIGGTMGLLTGFSILSGVEIIYFLLRFLLYPFKNLFFSRLFMSFKFPWVDVVSAVKRRFANNVTPEY